MSSFNCINTIGRKRGWNFREV